jgi:hypothetical protein
MKPFTDLTGQKFNRLTVLALHHKDMRFRAYWTCQCDCGNVIIVRSDCLRSGNTKGCGCLQPEASRKNLLQYTFRHGEHGTRLYNIWRGMLYRCRTKNPKSGANYSMRGIRVCEEWKDFLNFKQWALSHGYDDSLTIDRIDVDGDYEPNNCRWANMLEQQNNRRDTIYVTFAGLNQPLRSWARQIGISPLALYQRIYKAHWPIERALTENVHGGKKI